MRFLAFLKLPSFIFHELFMELLNIFVSREMTASPSSAVWGNFGDCMGNYKGKMPNKNHRLRFSPSPKY